LAPTSSTGRRADRKPVESGRSGRGRRRRAPSRFLRVNEIAYAAPGVFSLPFDITDVRFQLAELRWPAFHALGEHRDRQSGEEPGVDGWSGVSGAALAGRHRHRVLVIGDGFIALAARVETGGEVRGTGVGDADGEFRFFPGDRLAP
jgi:hypothetical protein